MFALLVFVAHSPDDLFDPLRRKGGFLVLALHMGHQSEDQAENAGQHCDELV
jgi:hypothetical protein